MAWTIYALRCRDNGRMYIGRSGEPMRERFKKHVYRLNHKTHDSKEMQRDYDKYGKSSFEMVPIFKTDDYEYSKRLEKIVMLTLRTNIKGNGYNRQDPIFGAAARGHDRRTRRDSEEFLKARVINAVNDASTVETGYTSRQMKRWKDNPLSIKAIDLVRLESMSMFAEK